MSTAALTVDKLNLTLGDQLILDNFSCMVPRGKITVLVGPSGAGKSSLLKTIIRFLPSTGQIRFEGKPLEDLDIQQFRRNVIYVSQVPVVFPGTVADNINWGRSVWGLSGVDITKYLDLVGLPHELSDRLATELSVGQQQRLHLARSLALEPDVLLLDEPASSLDAISKESFEQLIFDLQDRYNDLTVMMITHDLNQAQRMADYAILIHEGRLVLQAEATEFFDKVQDMTEAEMLQELIGREEVSP